MIQAKIVAWNTFFFFFCKAKSFHSIHQKEYQNSPHDSTYILNTLKRQWKGENKINNKPNKEVKKGKIIRSVIRRSTNPDNETNYAAKSLSHVSIVKAVQ